MSIIDYLYKGAAPGERVATQKAVQNMPYGQIGKNILAEGGFGTGSNNRGYDPNFKGKGALPSNTALQKYVTGPYNYIKGGVSSIFGGNAAGNIGGGTPAQRQLFEKVASSPFSKTMGTAAKTALSASMTAGPTGAYAMYQMNKPSTPAGYDYVRDYDMGSITNAADAENALDYQNFSTGMMNADQNYPGAEQTKSPIAENDLTNYNEHYNMMPEEEKEGFLSFLQNAGVNTRDFVMDNAARYGGAKMGSSLATSIFGLNPISAIAGAVGGGIFGNRFTNQPYIGAGSLYDGAGGFSAAQLDRQNALGGYYSDAARNQRQQASRVGNLIDRAASGKNFSRTNLQNLGGFTDTQIDDIVGGSTQISPGTFTKESIDQSFAGEEGPTGGSTASSGTVDTGDFEQDGTGRQGYINGGIVGMYR